MEVSLFYFLGGLALWRCEHRPINALRSVLVPFTEAFYGDEKWEDLVLKRDDAASFP
jgi:hypothetical protein